MSQSAALRSDTRPGIVRKPDLPRWPVVTLFVWFPLWWALGLVDVIWIPIAVLMALYLRRSGSARVPRGFGVWLFFLAWSAASVIMLDTAADVLGFGYRLGLYLAGSVLFVYLYNGGSWLSQRFVAGCLTCWWVVTVAGGYLGVLFPTGLIRTPLSFVLPSRLLDNPLVDYMVVRRFTQYNPDSYLQVAPRPSAPYLYTNNWGNVYSLLLPFVVAYLVETRGERRQKWVIALLPVSAVPALLTLNRGMFLGLGLAVLYAAVRLAMRRRFHAVIGLTVLSAIAVALFAVLPVGERLGDRLSDTAERTSTDTRASLYVQSLESVRESPVFGHGAPVEGDNPRAAPVGTQGQVWMVLVSHGPVALACFVGWFLIAFLRSWRRTDPVGMAANTALLVGTVELAYYGIVPYGLPIMMAAAALGMRTPDLAPPPMRPSSGRPAARRVGR